MPQIIQALFNARMLRQLFASYWEPTQLRLKTDDVNEILAWLDYCIIKRWAPGKFEQCVVAHLSHCRQKSFAFEQIDLKLKELWHCTSETDHKALYRIGTKALRRHLRDERVEAIQARVQQLLKQPIPEYAKSDPRRVQKERKKRKVEHISADTEDANCDIKLGKKPRLDSRDSLEPEGSSHGAISVQVRHWRRCRCEEWR